MNAQRQDRYGDGQIEGLRDELMAALNARLPTEEERQWVRMAMQAQAQSYRLRQAIIEKSLTALVLAAIGAVGVILYEYIQSHGWKP